jgi:hypothetical protein
VSVLWLLGGVGAVVVAWFWCERMASAVKQSLWRKSMDEAKCITPGEIRDLDWALQRWYKDRRLGEVGVSCCLMCGSVIGAISDELFCGEVCEERCRVQHPHLFQPREAV